MAEDKPLKFNKKVTLLQGPETMTRAEELAVKNKDKLREKLMEAARNSLEEALGYKKAHPEEFVAWEDDNDSQTRLAIEGQSLDELCFTYASLVTFKQSPIGKRILRK